MFRILLVIASVFLTACSSEVTTTAPQQWKDLTFRIEARPPQLRPGMVEFLVIANRDVKKRAHDLLVSIRMGEMGKWTQAIQDGHTGVYRRAIKVLDPDSDILMVHVKYKGEEKLFAFPLAEFDVRT